MRKFYLGLQMVARTQKKFGTNLRAVKLYQYPTIRALAEYLIQEENDVPPDQNIQARAQRQKAAQSRRQRLGR